MNHRIWPHEVDEVRVIYMHDCNLHNNKKGVGIHEVYAIAMETRGEDDNRPMTVQRFVYEQAKDSYCRQVLSTIRYHGSTYNYD